MEPNGELFDEIMAEVDAGLDLPAWPFHYRAFPYLALNYSERVRNRSGRGQSGHLKFGKELRVSRWAAPIPLIPSHLVSLKWVVRSFH